MYPSAFHRELKNITGNATITDGFTGGYCSSAFYQELQHIYWICHYYRRNKFVGIFRVGIFFLRAISVCKTIGNISFTDWLRDGMWYYRWKICGRTLFVGDLVGKKITDKVWISYRQFLSVDKSVKSCSVIAVTKSVKGLKFTSILCCKAKKVLKEK